MTGRRHRRAAELPAGPAGSDRGAAGFVAPGDRRVGRRLGGRGAGVLPGRGPVGLGGGRGLCRLGGGPGRRRPAGGDPPDPAGVWAQTPVWAGTLARPAAAPGRGAGAAVAAGAGRPRYSWRSAPTGTGSAGWARSAWCGTARLGTVSATVTVVGPPFRAGRPGRPGRRRWPGGVTRWPGSCGNARPVTQVRWSEWAAPAGVAEHLAFIDRNCHQPHSAPARRPTASSCPGPVRPPSATRRPSRCRSRPAAPIRPGRHQVPAGARGRASNARAAAIGVLAGEVRLFSDRLDRRRAERVGPVGPRRAVPGDPGPAGPHRRWPAWTAGPPAWARRRAWSGRPTRDRWRRRRSGRGGGPTAPTTAGSMWPTGPAWPCRPGGWGRCWGGRGVSARSAW